MNKRFYTKDFVKLKLKAKMTEGRVNFNFRLTQKKSFL